MSEIIFGDIKINNKDICTTEQKKVLQIHFVHTLVCDSTLSKIFDPLTHSLYYSPPNISIQEVRRLLISHPLHNILHLFKQVHTMNPTIRGRQTRSAHSSLV